MPALFWMPTRVAVPPPAEGRQGDDWDDDDDDDDDVDDDGDDDA
jgi:hypothetical protein